MNNLKNYNHLLLWVIVMMMASCTGNKNTQQEEAILNGRMEEVSIIDQEGIVATGKWEALKTYLKTNKLAVDKGGKLEVVIPFDRHGASCLAPDSYTTEVSFGLSLPLNPEETIRVKSRVFHTEIDKQEGSYSTVLYLAEQKEDYVVYSSKTSPEQVLVLFQQPTLNQNYFYYFDGIEGIDNLLNTDLMSMEFSIETEEMWNGYPLEVSRLMK